MFDSSNSTAKAFVEATPAANDDGHRIDWNNTLMTGVGEIDDDHRELVVHYQALVGALNNGLDRSMFKERFRSFLTHVAHHFANEERMMIDLGYTDYLDHKAEHDKLLRDAHDFLWSIVTRFERHDCSALAKYLKYWLIDHIEKNDRKLAKFATGDVDG
jgi:hemerythrin